MIRKSTINNTVLLLISIVFVMSCTKDPNSPGLEYTPDMYRSPAIETYVDYGVVEGVERKNLTEKISSLHPPSGTIPYQENEEDASIMMPYAYKAPYNADKTHGLYGFPQDESAYEKSAEMKNPIEVSEKVLDEGRNIYENFCLHCHGETGEGNGKIAENGHIVGIPSFKERLKDLPEGQIFYSITYGKGLMGAHASLIDKKERWQLTHYIKLLQNGGEYPDESNEDDSSDENVEFDEEGNPVNETETIETDAEENPVEEEVNEDASNE